MKERPILFSAPMVRAILDGTKTQTRRIVKSRPDKNMGPRCVLLPNELAGEINAGDYTNCPYGHPGDRLWVRETWRIGAWDENRPAFAIDYQADGFCRREWLNVPDPMCDDGELFNRLWQQSTDDAIKALGQQDRYQWEPGRSPCRWRPSIHMPRWASRITLEVTGVRVERLKDISGSDAVAEGVRSRLPDNGIAVSEYQDLWESINGPGSWNANPWVLVVEFKVVEATK